MAVTYTNTIKDARLQAVIDAIDAGAGAGYIEIGTAGMALVLVKIILADPSATKSAGVLTLAGLPKSGTATGTGTAAAARIRDSNDADVVTGLSVGTGSEDIVLDNASIATDQVVNVTVGTITHG
jgi:hypothetical protein